MTSAMLAEFKRVNHKSRTKQIASIRLSDKAKSFRSNMEKDIPIPSAAFFAAQKVSIN